MKAIKLLVVLLSLAIVSCNEDEANAPSIVGKWRGTLAEITIQPFGLPTPISRDIEDFSAEIEFLSDGKVTLMQNGQPVEGTYQLADKKLTTDVPFATGLSDISGTFTVEQLTNNTLVVFLERENQTFTDPQSGITVTGDVRSRLHFERL
jgi:uncharacterized protein (TIGR03066 family)